MPKSGNTSDKSSKAVKKLLPSKQWPVYSKYKVSVDEESGESYVVACTSMAEPVRDETDEHGQRVKSYRGRDPMQDATPYQRGGVLPMAAFLTQNAPGLRTATPRACCRP